MTVQQSAAIVTQALQFALRFRRENPKVGAEEAVGAALKQFWRQYTPESQKAAERAIRGLYATAPATFAGPRIVEVEETPAQQPDPKVAGTPIWLGEIQGVSKGSAGKYAVARIRVAFQDGKLVKMPTVESLKFENGRWQIPTR